MSHDPHPTEPNNACVTVAWDDPKERQILCYRFIGMWEWYEFSQASTQAFRMIAEVPHNVNVIFDMRLSLDIPIGALKAMQRLLQFAPGNLDVIVVLSADKLTQMTFIMLLKMDKLLRRHITFARSREDALILLTQYLAQEVG